jgi:isochorismate hydrolase
MDGFWEALFGHAPAIIAALVASWVAVRQSIDSSRMKKIETVSVQAKESADKAERLLNGNMGVLLGKRAEDKETIAQLKPTQENITRAVIARTASKDHEDQQDKENARTLAEKQVVEKPKEG